MRPDHIINVHRYLHVKVGRVWVRYWKVYTLFGGDKTGVDLVLIFIWWVCSGKKVYTLSALFGNNSVWV